jgi:hypothetical protein
MTGDLPDYTKYVSPQPQQPVTVTGFGTKAETVAKKSVTGYGNPSLSFELDAPPVGKKTGLIMVVGSAEFVNAFIEIYAWQSDLWVSVMRYARILANDTKVLTFPCWIPTQDVGDGTTKNIMVQLTFPGCDCDLDLTVIYFEE